MVNAGNYHSYVLDNTKIEITIDCKKETINYYNVIAFVPGTDPVLRKEYISVGTYVNHIGTIEKNIYNRANDDVSACSIILEAAKSIAFNPPKRSVVFILYTSENKHTFYSWPFLNNAIPIEQILLTMNIEQVGNRNSDYHGIWSIGTPQFNESFRNIETVFNEADFKFEPTENYSSDLWSCYQKGIPAIKLSSCDLSKHYTLQDTIGLIDFDHLLIASNFLYSYILELGNKKQTFVTNQVNIEDSMW